MAPAEGSSGPESAGPLIVVVGPTAVGKSELALFLAQRLDGEVISADAMQVYRGLDVGTAKVDEARRDAVPHHCLDLVEPSQPFSAGEWARAAAAAVRDIRGRRRRPIVAGGSGLYLRALIGGLAPLPRRDRRWRRALEAIEQRRGPAHLFRMLSLLDPEWAATVGANDRQRILRGLEVTLRLGEPMSAALARHGWTGPHYEAIWLGLTLPRRALRQRIVERVDRMLAAGWVDEVEGLLAGGVGAEAPGLRAIGYRELAACLAGDMTLEEARRSIIVATGRYAKRQLTWFRRQTAAEWFDAAAGDAALRPRVLGWLEPRLR